MNEQEKNLPMDGNNEVPADNNPQTQPKEGLLAKAKRLHRNFIVWTRTTGTGRSLVRVKRVGEGLLAVYGLKKLVTEKPWHKKDVVVITEGDLDIPAEEPAEDLPAETGDEEIAEEQE